MSEASAQIVRFPMSPYTWETVQAASTHGVVVRETSEYFFVEYTNEAYKNRAIAALGGMIEYKEVKDEYDYNP